MCSAERGSRVLLGGLDALTSASKSLIIGLALMKGQLRAEQALRASRLEEEYQTQQYA